MYAQRLDTLRRIATDAGIDFVVLVPGPHFTYLTGAHMHLMERPTLGIFPCEGDPVFILPEMEVNKLADSPPYPLATFGYSDAEGHGAAFAQAVAALGLDGKRLGVEGLRLRFAEFRLLLQHAPNASVTDAEEALAELRLVKSEAEIDALRRAIALSEDALREVLGRVEAGMTETQIANALLIAMLERGGGAVPFEPLVLTGPQSALPHGVPGSRALQPGEILLIDYGTRVDGYASDITRTFALGELTDQRLLDAYAAVLAANAAGRAAAGPGVPCQAVDRAARAEIEKAGFGEYFIHRTGHGLGMEAHEGPFIREGNTQPLAAGHVITVEPGIYLPGVGGIRIEDDVLITDAGAESLTTFDRGLMRIDA